MISFSWDNSDNPWGKPKAKPSEKKSAGSSRRRPAQAPTNTDFPDLEQLFAKAQKMFSTTGSGGNGSGMNMAPKGIGFFVVIALVLWLLSGFYIVAPDEEGVVLRFGKYVNTTNPGLNYKLPAPIEEVIRPQVTRENIAEIGFRAADNATPGLGAALRRNGQSSQVSVPQESLMLTGDENIVDLTFTVRWRIGDARDYLFNISNPDETIKSVAESAMREVIGSRPIDDALTESKQQIQQEAKELIQQILDSYQAGVLVNQVELQQVNPPEAVIDAFRDVQAARADAEREQNQATGYANDILPRARGEAAQVLQAAEGYKQSRVAEAEGSAARFVSQQAAYAKAKDVTSKRLYLETMEKVLKDARKVIMSNGSKGESLLPYFNVNELQQRKTPAATGASK